MYEFLGRWAIQYPTNGLYVSAAGGSTLTATASQIGPTERFFIWATDSGMAGYEAVWQLEANLQYVEAGECNESPPPYQSPSMCPFQATATSIADGTTFLVAPDPPNPPGFGADVDGSVGILSVEGGSTFGFYATTNQPAGSVVVSVITPGLPDIRNFGGAGVSFAGFPLAGQDFSGGLHLEGADFSYADLTSTDFTGAFLTGAKFIGATLAGTIFTGADLTNATLSNQADTSLPAMDLTTAVFGPGTVLTGANLGGANLSNHNLANFDLDGTVFTGGNLAGVTLTGASMAGTNFSSVDLRQTTFGPSPRFSTSATALTDFSGAVLDFSVIGLNWSYLNLVGTTIENLPVVNSVLDLPGLNAVSANLANIDLHNANLVGAVFNAVTLTGANLAGANLELAQFTGGCVLGGEGLDSATLSTAYLFDANLTNAQLSGVNFSGAYLYGSSASLSGATMPGVDFSNAYLAEIDLSDVVGKNLVGAIFDRACLVNCSFTGTAVGPDAYGKGGSFVGACLQGADFTGANLAGADLDSAGVTGPNPPDKFMATIQIPGTGASVLSITVNEAGTVLPESATNAQTICPNKEYGPCTASMLVSSDAPTSWPSVASGAQEQPTQSQSQSQ